MIDQCIFFIKDSILKSSLPVECFFISGYMMNLTVMIFGYLFKNHRRNVMNKVFLFMYFKNDF